MRIAFSAVVALFLAYAYFLETALGETSDFAHDLKNQTILMGHTAMFSCSGTGEDDLIGWIRDKKVLAMSDFMIALNENIDVVKEGLVSTLSVHNVTSEDEGQYRAYLEVVPEMDVGLMNGSSGLRKAPILASILLITYWLV